MASSRPVLPRLVVNFKAYPQALGPRAVALARAAAGIEAELGLAVAVCPQAVDVRACAEAGARVFAQHFDRVEKPEATGWQALDALRDAGCVGSLINHSEHRLKPEEIGWFVDAARSAGLVALLCTKDAEESERLAASRPHLVAVEPPELIGGDVSVTTADPGVVRRSVLAVQGRAPGTPVLCGAGVKNGEDVAKAIELGAHGILVASGVTRAKDPDRALRDLAAGFSKGRASTTLK